MSSSGLTIDALAPCPDKAILAGVSGSFVPCPCSVLAGRHDDPDLICLTRQPVNNPKPHAVRAWCDIGAGRCLKKQSDTVAQPPSAEIGVSHMPALKAKKLRKLSQGKVLLEL